MTAFGRIFEVKPFHAKDLPLFIVFTYKFLDPCEYLTLESPLIFILHGTSECMGKTFQAAMTNT